MCRFLRKSTAILCVALMTAFAVGCSDDDNGNGNGDNGNDVGNGDNDVGNGDNDVGNGDNDVGNGGNGFVEDTLDLSGDINDYDGSGGELNALAGFTEIGEGNVDADGSFSLTLAMTEQAADELEPLHESSLDGFAGFVCREDLLDDVGDAQFLYVPHLGYMPEGGEQDDHRMLELSTDAEGTAGSSGRPYPNQDHVYVTWLYSTDDLTLEETCDDGEIDVELQAGWNEVNIDTTGMPETYIQWTGDRPENVDWYLEQVD